MCWLQSLQLVPALMLSHGGFKSAKVWQLMVVSKPPFIDKRSRNNYKVTVQYLGIGIWEALFVIKLSIFKW